MTEAFIYTEIGRVIRERRDFLKLTQEKLALQIGISRTALANIESGRQRMLVHKLYEFSSVLGLKIQDLLPQNYDEEGRKLGHGPLLPKKGLNRRQRDQLLELMQPDLDTNK